VLLGTKGYSFTVSAACATGAAAIGQAYQLIGAGFQDRALAGGFMEDSWEYACNFDALKAFSMREDDPAASSRPFDRDRDGLVPSAGGSILILEELEAAQARGATIHAEIAGYSFSSDAKDMTAPSGEGGERAIRQALKDSGAERVDYINAHATATTVGDVVEAQVIARIFGDGPRVTSTKSMTGHEGAAAGSNEVVYTLLMMGADFIAPSLNLEHLDPQCEGIRVVTGDAIDADIRVAASNSFGFGGVNTCLVLTKP
jgi:3-oxoacyl-[acyl-carrier-protein] synthase-1